MALSQKHIRWLGLTASVAVMLTAASAGWWMLHSTSLLLTQTVRNSRSTVPMMNSIRALTERLRAVALEPAALKELEQLSRSADAAQRRFDLRELTSISQRMLKLMYQLEKFSEAKINRDSQSLPPSNTDISQFKKRG